MTGTTKSLYLWPLLPLRQRKKVFSIIDTWNEDEMIRSDGNVLRFGREADERGTGTDVGDVEGGAESVRDKF